MPLQIGPCVISILRAGLLLILATEALAEDTPNAVRRAETIGRAIFDQDMSSAKATDVLFEKVDPRQKGVQGWITLKRKDAWLVRFIGETDGTYVAHYDVKLPHKRLDSEEVVSLDPPQPLSPENLAMFRARQTALTVLKTGRCTEQYNTVVFSGTDFDTEGFVVYLLAATTRPDEIMVGGHFRVELSREGMEVVHVKPLSKGCLAIPIKTDHQVNSAFFTHLISSTPTETHVYLSLLNRLPLYVRTDLGLWKIENGKILLKSDQSAK